MSEVTINLTREEVVALSRNCKNEFENIWNNFITEVFCRGRTNLSPKDYIDVMKNKLDRLLIIVDTQKIKKFEEDLSRTLNCPSVLVIGEQNGK
jgi:hypothetical protein